MRTPQEHDAQQYEGGSTLFGRYTLPAYQQRFATLADALRTDSCVPAPRDLSQFQPYFGPGVDHDEPPAGRAFGRRARPAGSQNPDRPTDHRRLRHRRPRNDPRRGGTFFEIQRLSGDSRDGMGTVTSFTGTSNDFDVE